MGTETKMDNLVEIKAFHKKLDNPGWGRKSSWFCCCINANLFNVVNN